MDASYIQARIDKTKLTIEAYEDAVLALGVGGATQSYMLDTGQSIQKVVRADIPALNDMIDSLLNRCATLEARLKGSGSMTVSPAW